MTIWRYRAVPLTGGAPNADAPLGGQRGELAGESAAEVRASLRRIGLQVVELKPVRKGARRVGTERVGGESGAGRWWELGVDWVTGGWRSHLRQRRRAQKAELQDSLATMLEAGMPLVECVGALAASRDRRQVGLRGRAAGLMLVELRESLRSGSSLADAMRAHPAWFDVAEIAMVESGQLGGELPMVLRSLADRHERSGELGSRLAQAMTYPAVITVVGLGVVVFLSTRTLPKLVGILSDAKVPTPRLTEAVMGFGRVIAMWWPLMVLGAAVCILGVATGLSLVAARKVQLPKRLRRCVPTVLRRLAIARMTIGLADLVRTGVPLVDAVRAVAPTIGGVTALGLRRRLLEAACRVERGESLSDALDDPIWFDEELRRMLQVAERSGELDTMLRRLGERTQRQTKRLIDRMAALLEPAVILLLAAMVGTVVMAAVLPLIRMQEVIR